MIPEYNIFLRIFLRIITNKLDMPVGIRGEYNRQKIILFLYGR